VSVIIVLKKYQSPHIAGYHLVVGENNMKEAALNAFLILILFCAIPLVSCRPSYTYQMPEQTNDGWQTTSLDDVGMNKKILGELIDRINRNEYQNIHSILIVKDGKLVFEEYFNGYSFDFFSEGFQGEFTEFGIDTLHNVASVTKAYTSALVGIAIDHGFIQNVGQKVFDFFPEYSRLRDESKDVLTLEHLLTFHLLPYISTPIFYYFMNRCHHP